MGLCKAPSRCSWSLENKHTQVPREVTGWAEAGDRGTSPPLSLQGAEETMHRIFHSERLQISLLLTVFPPCRDVLATCLSECGKEMTPSMCCFSELPIPLVESEVGRKGPTEEGSPKASVSPTLSRYLATVNILAVPCQVPPPHMPSTLLPELPVHKFN